MPSTFKVKEIVIGPRADASAPAISCFSLNLSLTFSFPSTFTVGSFLVWVEWRKKHEGSNILLLKNLFFELATWASPMSLLKKQSPELPPSPPESKFALWQTPSWFICTLKFEEFWCNRLLDSLQSQKHPSLGPLRRALPTVLNTSLPQGGMTGYEWGVESVAFDYHLSSIWPLSSHWAQGM